MSTIENIAFSFSDILGEKWLRRVGLVLTGIVVIECLDPPADLRAAASLSTLGDLLWRERR
ncbi:MAG: hypothetical protein NZM04_03475 [Methylacidiphilales bacterium]|nr:hypothetical protein [Candidatus Methylacidiphilales bacterium]MDW8349960.1 hypothetical protein [Verrucomicrobiae bacterium]